MKSYVVAKDSPEAKALLWTSRKHESGEELTAIAEELLPGLPSQPPELRFSLFRPDEIAAPSLVRRYVAAARVFSLTAMFSPCFVVLLIAIARRIAIHWFTAGTALLGVLLLQIAVNVFNDVEDHLRQIDLPGGIGGSGVIQKGWLSARDLQRMGWIALVLGLLLGIPSLVGDVRIFLFVGAMALVGVVGYSGRPFSLKYRALGDIAVWLLCGPVLTIAFSIAATSQVSSSEVALGAVFGFAAVGILHANNLTDIPSDRERGVRTIAVALGFAHSRRFLAAAYAAMFLAAIGLYRVSIFLPLSLLLTVPTIATTLRRVFRASGPLDPSIRLIRFEAAKVHLIAGGAIAIGVVLAIVTRAIAR